MTRIVNGLTSLKSRASRSLVERVDPVKVGVCGRIGCGGHAEGTADEPEDIAVLFPWQGVLPPFPLCVGSVRAHSPDQNLEHIRARSLTPPGELGSENLRVSDGEHGEEIP